MNRLTRLLILLLSPLTAGCLTPVSDGSTARTALRSVDGLERRDFGLEGVLELRDDHRIGMYDAFLIPRATMSYARDSRRLTTPARRVFLSLLHQSLVEAAIAADVPITNQPGPCVMEINLAVVGLDLDIEAEDLADLTLVMQFRDSTSREPLLRYATQDRIPQPDDDISRARQLQRGFDRIVAKMNIASAMRASGLTDDDFETECNRTLAARGRAAAAARE